MRYDGGGNLWNAISTIGRWQMGTSSRAGPERGKVPGAPAQQCWTEFLQQQAPIAAAMGLAAGLANGLIGVGSLARPASAMLSGFSQHHADGAVLAVVLAVPVSALGYAAQGTVAWPPPFVLSVGLALYALIGAGLTWRIPARQRQRGLVLVLLAVAARLLLG